METTQVVAHCFSPISRLNRINTKRPKNPNHTKNPNWFNSPHIPHDFPKVSCLLFFHPEPNHFPFQHVTQVRDREKRVVIAVHVGNLFDQIIEELGVFVNI